MSTCTPSYRVELTEEQLVLLVAMLGVSLEESPGTSPLGYSTDILEVMRSLAAVLLAVEMPGELREILGPALTRLMVSVVLPAHSAASVVPQKH